MSLGGSHDGQVRWRSGKMGSSDLASWRTGSTQPHFKNPLVQQYVRKAGFVSQETTQRDLRE